MPLSDMAVAVLRRQLAKKRAPECVDTVFVYHGKPVYQTVTAAWRKALKRAGIRNFRRHDLPHTWTSSHLQRDTPLQVQRARRMGNDGDGATVRAPVGGPPDTVGAVAHAGRRAARRRRLTVFSLKWEKPMK